MWPYLLISIHELLISINELLISINELLISIKMASLILSQRMLPVDANEYTFVRSAIYGSADDVLTST